MAVKPLVGAQLNRAHPLAQGLVGCWLFNEGSGGSVYDYSGRDNHGTLVNGPTWGTGPDGGAVSFDGTTNNAAYGHVLVPDAPSLDITSAITLIVRARPASLSSLSADAFRPLVVKRVGSITNYEFRQNSAWPATGGADAITFACYNNGWCIYVMDAVVAANTWSHWAVTYDNTTCQMYHNGVPQTTTLGFGTAGKDMLANDAPLSIGGSSAGEDEFDGLISEAMTYDRALSADEIAWLYAEPYAMFVRPDRWWRLFDFGGGGAAYRPWLITGGRMR